MLTRSGEMLTNMGASFFFIALLALGGVILGANDAAALDGFAFTVRYELPQGQMGNIHDGNVPGTLMRYDIKGGKVVDSTAIASDATWPCICPFGKRVAFLDADENLHVINIDGSDKIDLGHAAAPMWPAGDDALYITRSS